MVETTVSDRNESTNAIRLIGFNSYWVAGALSDAAWSDGLGDSCMADGLVRKRVPISYTLAGLTSTLMTVEKGDAPLKDGMRGGGNVHRNSRK
ncbi:hypothetical protein GCM10007086_44590 [Photobacterium aphoticum]|nr:hypothetical protein GCM10007086_44590 [Photobacterium aphoticum]